MAGLQGVSTARHVGARITFAVALFVFWTIALASAVSAQEGEIPLASGRAEDASEGDTTSNAVKPADGLPGHVGSSSETNEVAPALDDVHFPSVDTATVSPPPDEDDYELQRLLIDAMDQVQRGYVTPISKRQLIHAAIRGVLSELDPYSNYIPPEEMPRFHRAVDDEFAGVGIRVEMDRGQLIVLTPMPQTPAFDAGIAAGDAILEIDGQSTKGMRLDEAVAKLQGDIGTDVTLLLRHRGQTETFTVKLTREVIEVETVLGYRRLADGQWDFHADTARKIGYIRLSGFSRNTARTLRRTLVDLREDGLAGLILDLRFNPGGLLASAIEICDMFISEGLIVSIRGRAVEERQWTATRRGTFDAFPMVVLVNQFSASASEVTSACLQDHQRAVIMGERTWGKGSVQNVTELEGGASALKITTATYHRPSGRNIHRLPDADDEAEWGVVPDDGYARPLSNAEARAILDSFRLRDVIPTRANRRTTTLPRDPHLDMALQHLRAAVASGAAQGGRP